MISRSKLKSEQDTYNRIKTLENVMITEENSNEKKTRKSEMIYNQIKKILFKFCKIKEDEKDRSFFPKNFENYHFYLFLFYYMGNLNFEDIYESFLNFNFSLSRSKSLQFEQEEFALFLYEIEKVFGSELFFTIIKFYDENLHKNLFVYQKMLFDNINIKLNNYIIVKLFTEFCCKDENTKKNTKEAESKNLEKSESQFSLKKNEKENSENSGKNNNYEKAKIKEMSSDEENVEEEDDYKITAFGNLKNSLLDKNVKNDIKKNVEIKSKKESKIDTDEEKVKSNEKIIFENTKNPKKDLTKTISENNKEKIIFQNIDFKQFLPLSITFFLIYEYIEFTKREEKFYNNLGMDINKKITNKKNSLFEKFMKIIGKKEKKDFCEINLEEMENFVIINKQSLNITLNDEQIIVILEILQKQFGFDPRNKFEYKKISIFDLLSELNYLIFIFKKSNKISQEFEILKNSNFSLNKISTIYNDNLTSNGKLKISNKSILPHIIETVDNKKQNTEMNKNTLISKLLSNNYKLVTLLNMIKCKTVKFIAFYKNQKLKHFFENYFFEKIFDEKSNELILTHKEFFLITENFYKNYFNFICRKKVVKIFLEVLNKKKIDIEDKDNLITLDKNEIKKIIELFDQTTLKLIINDFFDVIDLICNLDDKESFQNFKNKIEEENNEAKFYTEEILSEYYAKDNLSKIRKVLLMRNLLKKNLEWKPKIITKESEGTEKNKIDKNSFFEKDKIKNSFAISNSIYSDFYSSKIKNSEANLNDKIRKKLNNKLNKIKESNILEIIEEVEDSEFFSAKKNTDQKIDLKSFFKSKPKNEFSKSPFNKTTYSHFKSKNENPDKVFINEFDFGKKSETNNKITFGANKNENQDKFLINESDFRDKSEKNNKSKFGVNSQFNSDKNENQDKFFINESDFRQKSEKNNKSKFGVNSQFNSDFYKSKNDKDVISDVEDIEFSENTEKVSSVEKNYNYNNFLNSPSKNENSDNSKLEIKEKNRLSIKNYFQNLKRNSFEKNDKNEKTTQENLIKNVKKDNNPFNSNFTQKDNVDNKKDIDSKKKDKVENKNTYYKKEKSFDNSSDESNEDEKSESYCIYDNKDQNIPSVTMFQKYAKFKNKSNIDNSSQIKNDNNCICF